MAGIIGLSDHEYFMREALKQAQEAYRMGEVPIGALITVGGRIVAKAFNQVETLQDPTAHAELLAITGACSALNSKVLKGCTLYVTLEPCPMCMAALRFARVSEIVFGAADPKGGFRTFAPTLPRADAHLVEGVCEPECRTLLQRFFKERRL